VVESLALAANPGGPPRAFDESKVALPRELWLKLVRNISPRAVARSDHDREADDGTLASPTQEHSAKVLAVALRTCARPSDAIIAELWQEAVASRAVEAVRLLRAKGFAPPATPRDETLARSSSWKALFGTPPQIKAAPVANRTEGEGRTGRQLFEEVAQAATRTARARAASPADGEVNGGEEALLNELVQCNDVRAHLDETVQVDRDCSLAPPPGPEGLSPRSRQRRSTVLQGLAGRLVGRAALRSQGVAPRAPAMPAVQPLPPLWELAPETAVRLEAAPKCALAAYSGTWVAAQDGRVVCEIKDGKLLWGEHLQTADAQLSIGAQDGLIMELDGAVHRGTLDAKGHLLWDDGDVWLKGPKLAND